MSDMSQKKETAESKKAREQREQRELQEKRNQQLLDAQRALEELQEQLRSTRSTIKECGALSSHSNGFYEEINKLTKGRILIGVTDLAVAQANDIIRDAKKIVKNDVHLDRIKEFVPAGDNPVYPDVLLLIRSVRDSLDRCDTDLENRLKIIRAQIEKAHTAIGALEYFLDDDETDEEDKHYPRRSAVEPYVEGNLSDSCFSTFRDTYEKYFDFDRLDRQTVEGYLSMSTENEESHVDGDAHAEETDGIHEIELPDLDEHEEDEQEDQGENENK